MADPTAARRDDPRRHDKASTGGPSIGKWQLGILGVFLVVYAITVLATGQAEFLIPVVILAVLVVGYAGLNRLGSKRIVERDGSLEDAMSDNENPIPSAHLIPDEMTALGDTPEAHDEISPHDLPLDHPGRHAAEELAGEQSGTTTGHRDPSQVREG